MDILKNTLRIRPTLFHRREIVPTESRRKVIFSIVWANISEAHTIQFLYSIVIGNDQSSTLFAMVRDIPLVTIDLGFLRHVFHVFFQVQTLHVDDQVFHRFRVILIHLSNSLCIISRQALKSIQRNQTINLICHALLVLTSLFVDRIGVTPQYISCTSTIHEISQLLRLYKNRISSFFSKVLLNDTFCLLNTTVQNTRLSNQVHRILWLIQIEQSSKVSLTQTFV